jgi:hypothetical protein
MQQKNTTPCNNIPLHYLWITGFSSFPASHVTVSCYCASTFLIMFKDRTFKVPEHCKHTLSSRWLCFKFHRKRSCWVLPLHPLVFPFWIIMVDPGLVSSDDGIQKIFASSWYCSKRRELMSK